MEKNSGSNPFAQTGPKGPVVAPAIPQTPQGMLGVHGQPAGRGHVAHTPMHHHHGYPPNPPYPPPNPHEHPYTHYAESKGPPYPPNPLPPQYGSGRGRGGPVAAKEHPPQPLGTHTPYMGKEAPHGMGGGKYYPSPHTHAAPDYKYTPKHHTEEYKEYKTPHPQLGYYHPHKVEDTYKYKGEGDDYLSVVKSTSGKFQWRKCSSKAEYMDVEREFVKNGSAGGLKVKVTEIMAAGGLKDYVGKLRSKYGKNFKGECMKCVYRATKFCVPKGGTEKEFLWKVKGGKGDDDGAAIVTDRVSNCPKYCSYKNKMVFRIQLYAYIKPGKVTKKNSLYYIHDTALAKVTHLIKFK